MSNIKSWDEFRAQLEAEQKARRQTWIDLNCRKVSPVPIWRRLVDGVVNWLRDGGF